MIQQCTVAKGWIVPRFFKFFFQLMNYGDKSYICEHDLFVFLQELEGVAPGNLNRVQKEGGDV